MARRRDIIPFDRWPGDIRLFHGAFQLSVADGKRRRETALWLSPPTGLHSAGIWLTA
jgi:hypothetical protein